MGKLLVLLCAVAAIGGAISFSQNEAQNVETSTRQADRQYEMLTRELARSGYNMMMSKTRKYESEHEGITASQLANAMPGASSGWATHENGGEYRAYLQPVGLSSFRIVGEGRFVVGTKTHLHTLQRTHLADSGLPIVPGGATPGDSVEVTLDVDFILSMAGWCSAIYLERFEPIPAGPSMPGAQVVTHGAQSYVQLTPEMVVASGRNRSSEPNTYAVNMAPGTLLNFILAVDKDCSLRDQTVPMTAGYDHTLDALVNESGLGEMTEGLNVMIEPHRTQEGVWRFGFEDQKRFTEAQHNDVKLNGYGDGSWQQRGDQWSYGGSGWTSLDANGYRELRDFGGIPDYSDQVFEVTVTTTPPPAS
ncbi:MAG: hypothetical protein AAF970_14275 [Bacteroidota bacterium]